MPTSTDSNHADAAPGAAKGSLFRTDDGASHLTTFILVCGLFCLSGLCNGMIDVLNKHFQNSLQVTKAQSALVQGFWYAGYFLLALPAGMFARRFGYRGGILFGLSVITIGCVCFVPVTRIAGSQTTLFTMFLCALGLVACGFTFIETIANPYATVLGAPESGVARINLAQNRVHLLFFCLDVRGQPRRELARRVQDDDLDSVVSFRSSFGSTRRDSSRRWL